MSANTAFHIAVLPGDGIGIEVMTPTLEILAHIQKTINFSTVFQRQCLIQALTAYARLEGFTEERYGGIVSRYRNSFGEYQIVVDRHLRNQDILFLTRKFIGIGPLGERSFKVKLLPETGDYHQWYLLGEYTMEVRNATRAHGWIHNLATS